jgi:2'-5' RNA ligase
VSTGTVRAFVAVHINPGVRDSLARLRDRFADVDAKIKWVEPNNIHLTLAFLGDMDEALASVVADALDGAACGIETFSCTVEGIGVFGSQPRPRIIWAGMKAPASLVELHARVSRTLSDLEIPFDRKPFRPHLTVARVRSARDTGLLAERATALADAAFGATDVKAIHLVRSVLTPDGPIYTVLHSTALSVPPHQTVT